MSPAPEIARILAKAYRCDAFDCACAAMRWRPEVGHIPRGYTGATTSLGDIRLVICLAEPGDPLEGEHYEVRRPRAKIVAAVAQSVASAIASGGRGFHGNLAYVLDRCWPRLTLREQLERTWITEATLCSASATTDAIPKQVEAECAARCLKQQLSLLPNAFVLALGGKAERRLVAAGRTPDAVARAVGRPIGSRFTAETSWKAAGTKFRSYLKKRPNHGVQ